MKLIICGPWCTKLFELVINRDKPFKLHISKVNEDGRGTAQPQHTNYSDSNVPGCCGGCWVGLLHLICSPSSKSRELWAVQRRGGQTSPAPLGLCFIRHSWGSFPLTNKNRLYKTLQCYLLERNAVWGMLICKYYCHADPSCTAWAVYPRSSCSYVCRGPLLQLFIPPHSLGRSIATCLDQRTVE